MEVEWFYYKKWPFSGHIKAKKIVPMPFGSLRNRKALTFVAWSPFFIKKFQSHYKGDTFWQPFLSKKFNHITKNTSVFHLKLGDSRELNYFSTFTLSKHTSHHHDWSTANCYFLTYKYDWLITGGHEKIFTVTLNKLMSCHFSLFLNFTPFYISLIYIVFFNKAFQDCPLKTITYGAVVMV